MKSCVGIGVAVCAALALLAGGNAGAQTSGWWGADASGNWSDATKWTTTPAGGYPDGIGASAGLTNNITAARTNTLDVSVTLGALAIGDPTGADNQYPYTLTNNPGCAITMDTGGAGAATITRKGVRVNSSMYPDIVLNTNLIILVNINGTSWTFDMYGAISGPNRSVTCTTTAGSGNYLGLRSTNSSYSGRTIVTGSAVRVTFNSIANVGGGNSSLGAPATVADGTIQLGAGAESCDLVYAGSAAATTDRILDMAGANGATRSLSCGAGSLTFTSPFIYSGGSFVGTLNVGTIGGGAGYLAILGAITNTGLAVNLGLNGSGTGNSALLGLNTYTNATTIARSTHVINSIADADGTPSSLGAPATLANGTITMNAGSPSDSILKYIGIGHASSRAFSLSGTGTGVFTLNASGYGKLTLSGGVTNGGASTKNFALTGTGEGELSGVIYDYDATRLTSLTKSGAGTWTVKGDNKFTGTVTLNGAGGRLIMGHANALGLGSGAIALTAGTLDPGDAARTVANPVTLTAHTIAGTNDLTTSGALTASGANGTLTSSLGAGNVLTLNAVVLTHTAATTFYLDGTGSNVINGVISESGTGAKSVAFRNSGTTRIKNDNTYTGSTTIEGGGTVILDYTVNTGSRFSDAATLYLGGQAGGDLVLDGTPGGSGEEVVGVTTQQNSGAINISRASGTGVLNLGAVYTNDNPAKMSTLNFKGDGIGRTTTPNRPGGTLDRGIYVNGDSYGYADGSGYIKAYSGSTDMGPLLPAGPWTATANYHLADSTPAQPSGTISCHTLKLSNDADDGLFNLNGKTLDLLGGLLYTGGFNNKYTITNGNLHGSTRGLGYLREIYVKEGCELTISAGIGVSGMNENFAKAGPGTMIVNTAQSWGRSTYTLEGVWRVRHDQGIGGASIYDHIVLESVAGSAVELEGPSVGTGLTVLREFTLSGRGVNNRGALRSIRENNTCGGIITIGSHGARINADADTLTLTGGVATASGLDVTFGGAGDIRVSTAAISGGGAVTKDGAGTLTLASANTHTGPTTVNAGTLKVTGSIATGSKVTVNSGATLSGNGTCSGEVWVKSNGTIKAEGGSLTAGNLALFGGSKVEFNGTDKIVVANVGSIADQTGLTIMPGAQVQFAGSVAGGTYTLFQYSGMLNGSATNFSVSNPVGGDKYVFSTTGTAVTLGVIRSGGSLLMVR